MSVIWVSFFSGKNPALRIDGNYVGIYSNLDVDDSYSQTEYKFQFKNGKFFYEQRTDSAQFYIKGKGKYKIVDSTLILNYTTYKNKELLEYTHSKSDTTGDERIFIIDVNTNDEYYTQTYTYVALHEYSFGTCLTHKGREVFKLGNKQPWDIEYVEITPLNKGIGHKLPIKCGNKNLHKIKVDLTKAIPTYKEDQIDSLQILKIEGNELILKEIPPQVFAPMIKELVAGGQDINELIRTFEFTIDE